MNDAIQRLYDSEKIKKAMAFLKEDAENTVAQQIELAGIPAYSNHEEKKAARFREIIEEMGYQTMQDEAGNVSVPPRISTSAKMSCPDVPPPKIPVRTSSRVACV